jgi:hypothetical protein
METQPSIESVTKSETSEFESASWNQPRSNEQLLGFIARREAMIFATDEGN